MPRSFAQLGIIVHKHSFDLMDELLVYNPENDSDENIVKLIKIMDNTLREIQNGLNDDT